MFLPAVYPRVSHFRELKMRAFRTSRIINFVHIRRDPWALGLGCRPTVKRVMEHRPTVKRGDGAQTNSETGVERPTNPLQKAVLYKDASFSPNSETGIKAGE